MPFIALGIGGIAAGLWGAHEQSKAAGKAVDAQSAAAEKALALQAQIYNTTRGDLAPYRNAGVTALSDKNGLMALLGLPSGGLSAGSVGAVGTGGPSYDPAISPGQANFDRYSPSGGYIGKDVPMAEHMTNPNVAVDASGYTAQQHGASPSQAIPTLRVRGPNGQIYNIPATDAENAKNNGGIILGNANG